MVGVLLVYFRFTKSQKFNKPKPDKPGLKKKMIDDVQYMMLDTIFNIQIICNFLGEISFAAFKRVIINHCFN